MGGDGTSETRVDDAKEAYRRAKVEYERIKSEHDGAVSRCKDALNEAKRSQKKTIASLNRQVASLENDLHGKVASVGTISLYHDRLEAGGVTYKLEHGLRVTVSTSGSKYSTTDVSGGGVSIGGAVVGAAIAGVPGAVIGGRKKVKSKEVVHDDRHLYVTIEGPRGGQAVSLNPDLEQQARSLASQVPGCINQYQGLVQDIPPKIKALKTKVEEAEKDDAVPTAQAELERTMNDTERLEAAKQARDEARQHYHDEKKQAKTPLFGLHPHGSYDDAGEAGAEEAAEPLGEAVAFEGEQGRPAPQAEAGAAQRGTGFSGILWKILGGRRHCAWDLLPAGHAGRHVGRLWGHIRPHLSRAGLWPDLPGNSPDEAREGETVGELRQPAGGPLVPTAGGAVPVMWRFLRENPDARP